MILINYNKLLHNNIIEKWEKAGYYVNDDGGMVTQIIEIISKTSFSTRFKLITNYKNKEHEFNNEPLRHLMKSCDDESRRVLKKIKNRTKESTMVNFGKYKLQINDLVMDRPVREAVRIIDEMDSENNAYLISTLSIAI